MQTHPDHQHEDEGGVVTAAGSAIEARRYHESLDP
jgi:hypothetical protein